MDVGLYGHVRQYTNIKDEIDAIINEVLLSGSHVQGPTLKAFFSDRLGVPLNSGVS